MLVLSRHMDESIIVGDNIEIMVVGIRHNEIQLGIIAPKMVPVHRKEVYGRICRERNTRRNEHLSYTRYRNALAVEV
jgi:carbon storage regulator